MKKCQHCGKSTNRLFGKWYQYDNGQQTLDFVCVTCADAHSKAVAA